MEDSSRYFSNRACKYYPCHKDADELNCLFCYCPLYSIKNCPGNPRFIEKPDGLRKVCTDCSFPHRAENYEAIMEILKKTGFF